MADATVLKTVGLNIRTGSSPVSGTSIGMRNPALLGRGRRVLFCGGVSACVSYARRVAPELLREPSDRISFRLIERVGIDLRCDGWRAVTKDLGYGHQRN